MQRIQTIEDAGPDRMIRLEIPVDEANRRYQVTVELQPAMQEDDQKVVQKPTWPPGFLNEMFGCLRDMDLVRDDQGEFS
ncbi:MAG: hypothetical protein ACREJM_03045 [Candidatus Saccharimonadales bacterium]